MVTPILAISITGDEDPNVRGRAARALGTIGCQSAVEFLIEAFKDEDDWVWLHAQNSLKKLTGQDFGTDYDAWKAWYEENEGK